MPPTDRRATYRQVLAQPTFRTLFCTRTLGIDADTLRIVALSTLVFATTGSPLLAAVTFGIGFVPQAIGAIGLGAVADRVAPRALIATGYLVEGLAGLTLAVRQPPVAVTLLIVGGVALFTPVFTGAGNRLIAEVLHGDAFVLGRSLTTVASSAAQLLGLAVGAAAVAVLRPQGALLVAAAAHAAAAIWSRFGLPLHPSRAASTATPSAASSAVRDSWAGTRNLLGDRRIRTLMLAQWLPPSVTTGAEALLIPYAAARDLPAGAGGLLLACTPIGMLLGDVVVARLLAPATRERLVIPLIVLQALPLTLFVLRPSLSLAAVLLAVTGVGYAYSLGLQRRFLDAIPEPRRGQAFGLLTAGLMTGQGLGPAVIGGVTEAVPVATAIAVAGAVTLALAVLLRLSLARSEVPASSRDVS